MEIIYLPTLIPFLKGRQLLLDTNIFRDAAGKPTVFGDFFNLLKENDTALTTADFVKFELLKGSADDSKYAAKEVLIDDIIDVTLPITSQTFKIVYELIKEYGIDGTGVTITDLFLGALLKQYGSNVTLLTRDTSDFIQKIFNLAFVVNVPHQKGILTYGVYQYKK